MPESIAKILEEDQQYFDYFKNAIYSGANYFEYEFVFGDSASARLFYVYKSQCKNSNEALVKLIIPFLYHQGCFRQSRLENLESIFDIVKEDMLLDIYWNTEYKDGKIGRLIEDLKIFPIDSDNEIYHFEFTKEGKYLKSKRHISELLDECKYYSHNLKLTEWHPSYEYFVETENYYILFNFSTGA